MARSLARQSRFLIALLAAIGLQLATTWPAHADPGSEVSKTSELAPAGEKVTISGSGFQSGITLFVVACDPAVANGGACDMANFGQVKTDASGAFTATITVVASFGTTDCLKIQCAIMTSKVGDGGDRSQETTVPIAFTGGIALPEVSPVATEENPDSATDDSDVDASAGDSSDEGSSTPLVVGGVVAVALVAGAALLLRRKRTAA